MTFFKRFSNALRILSGKPPKLNDKEWAEFSKKFATTIQEANQIGQAPELSDKYLFDFTQDFSSNFVAGNYTQYNAVTPVDAVPGDGPPIGGMTVSYAVPSAPPPRKTPEKQWRKPIEVLEELEKVPNSFSLENLDDKILMLKDKKDLITNHYAKRELSGLIERLENRKKYGQHKIFFTQFQSTTQEKIDALLKIHTNLVMKPPDIFIPEFPDVAVKIMKEYTRVVKEISGKGPIYYVIAPAEMFKEKYKKRDPIVLAQSPFSFAYDILGAYDDEMILLNEL